MSENPYVRLFVLVFLIGLPTYALSEEPDELTIEQQLLQTMHSIESQVLYSWVDTLASRQFEGRLTGTTGYNESAEWVVEHFKKWGVEPGGDNDTYLQAFPNPYTLVLPGSELYMHAPFGDGVVEIHYLYETDYYPGSTSDSGEVTGEVVYVGYGISAPELGYDDYAGLDVTGKIVVFEPEAPVSPRNDPETFRKWRKYSFHQYKLENAVAHGAAGMLYDYHIVNPNNAFAEGFVYAVVGKTVVADIFTGTGRVHKEVVEAIREKLEPRSFETGKVLTIKTVTEHHAVGIGYNVIGVIPGSDPALQDEAILIGAHLDHLGMSHEMMPGANDNASAVAVAMAMAKALTESPVKPNRSVVFLLFGAEEQAVVGSKYYLENPAYPIDKTVGLLNMDGVGCGNVISAGAALNYPNFWSYVERANDEYTHRIIEPYENTNLARPRLDAARFMWAGVPSISFGVSGSQSYYHSTLDNIETITPEVMEDLAQMLFMAVIDMGAQEQLDFRN
ncbi:MAG: M20/M25/M40 family metallo-hydrolase [bacterium]|nr:M20/M25/M40 family metallo-hydrolase [bacterium]